MAQENETLKTMETHLTPSHHHSPLHNPIIDHSPIDDVVIMKEPSLTCQTHVDFYSPKKSPPREISWC